MEDVRYFLYLRFVASMHDLHNEHTHPTMNQGYFKKVQFRWKCLHFRCYDAQVKIMPN